MMTWQEKAQNWMLTLSATPASILILASIERETGG